MPVIISSTIEFDPLEKYYYINLDKLIRIFPHIEKNNNLTCYFIEIRNEAGKLVKRFKPFKKIELKIKEIEISTDRFYKFIHRLVIPKDVASRFNIGNDYYITIVVTAYDGNPCLPLEFKFIGYDAERVFEYFSRIEAGLFSLNLEQPLLNTAVSYLWDAYVRLEENDIEGAKTSVRNSLYEIRDKFIPKIEVVEEAKDFPKNLKKLVHDLAEFTQYGGPHPGPAPRSTTEMIIIMTIELIRCLAKMLEDKTISLKTMEESEAIV
jgi:hypothetical protein